MMRETHFPPISNDSFFFHQLVMETDRKNLFCTVALEGLIEIFNKVILLEKCVNLMTLELLD